MAFWKSTCLLAAMLFAPCAALYAADGDLEDSFVATFPGQFDTGDALVIQPDGKIVLAGSTSTPDPLSMALERFDPDGTPDATFGTGGVVSGTVPNDRAIGLGIQSNGKLVALAASGAFRVSRFASNGSLDTAFGTGGTVTASCGGSVTSGAMVVQPDDAIVIAGGDGPARTCAVRLLADGTPDAAFAPGGTVIVLDIYALGVGLQPDGKLLMAGIGAANAPALARLETDGTLDAGFGSHGIAALDVAPKTGALRGIAIQPDGRIVAAGTITDGGDFTVVRYGTNGKPDPSFGTDGVVQTDVTGGEANYAAAFVAIQDDGKMLVAGEGSTNSPPFGTRSFALARYDVGGTLDASFGTAGLQLMGPSGTPTALRLQADGKAVLSGTSTNPSPTSTASVQRFFALTIGCAPTALAGCKTTVAPGGSQLKLSDSGVDKKDQWKWKWKGAATTVAELGDPLATDDYRLCLYDDSNGATFVSGAILKAGGTCHGKPCWQAKGTTGFGYKDSIGSRFGLTALKLKAGGDGSAQLQLQGRGGALPLPPMPVALPLRLQLSSGNGSCWEATFSATGLKRNEAGRFQGASD